MKTARRIVIAMGLLMPPLGMPALAETLIASRPGLMCTSADALARLTLPDGSDRAASPQARPGDATIDRQGGCIAIPHAAHVDVQTTRRYTSLVIYDAQDG